MFTAVILQGRDDWYVGYVAQLPGAYAQGRTIDELIANLRAAKQMAVQELERQNRDNFSGLRELQRVSLD
jgi:predicted RNase H-like HicB family nuclease